MTAGSDNHWSTPISPIYGIELEKRLTRIKDYVKIILEKGPIGLHVPEERFMMPDDVEIDERHRAWMLNQSEQDVPAPKEWI